MPNLSVQLGIISLLAELVVGGAVAAPAPVAWTVSPDFKKGEDARKNLSGAACSPRSNFNFCLAVNDEKKYAQFFTVGERSLRPTDLIRLLPDEVDGVEMDEIDAEAVAVSDADAVPAYFYVTGSHGLSRTSGEFRPSQFYVFRFPLDGDGMPAFSFSDENSASEIERSCRLGSIIAGDEVLGAFYRAPLDGNGANIEGMAAKGRDLYFGFRGPSVDGNAFVLRLPESALFPDDCTVPAASSDAAQADTAEGERFAIRLGEGIGIRDLVAVPGGFLILTGLAADVDGPADVIFWDETLAAESNGEESLRPLFHIDRAAKAESLTLLGSSEPDHYRLLIMFDGAKNGEPIYVEAANTRE
jgi:hypothetical protein